MILYVNIYIYIYILGNQKDKESIGNQNKEFVNKFCYVKQLMKMTIMFCETTIKETEHEIKEIDSKLQSNLPSTEHSTIKEQVRKTKN